MAQEAIQEARDERVPEKRGSYFARHWRGDISLPRSYWINGGLIFGLGCNFFFMIGVTIAIFALASIPALAVTVAVGEIALNIAAYVWALVGTWRAAKKYQGPKVWSILARIGMSLGIVISVGNLARTIQTVASVLESQSR